MNTQVSLQRITNVGANVKTNAPTKSTICFPRVPARRRKTHPESSQSAPSRAGWEDFTEGKRLRRMLLPEYDDTDTTSYDEDDDITPGYSPTTV